MEAHIVRKALDLLVVIVQAETPDLYIYINDDEYVVDAIAAFLEKQPEDIVVYCADNCIGPNLSTSDCDIRQDYCRLTVEHINKPTIISQNKCTPTPDEQARQTEQAEQEARNAPLRRVNACIGKHTSGLITVVFDDRVFHIFVTQITQYHKPFNKRFTYSTDIENISSEYLLDTKAIQSDIRLITFLRDPKRVFKSIEEHQEKYVLTLKM